MDRLTSKFQEALADAQSLAVGRDHQFIEPQHVLRAMLEQKQGTIRSLLQSAGANANSISVELNEAISRMPSVQGGAAGEVHISNELGRLLNVSDKLAQQRGDQYISSELFLLAATKEKGGLSDLLRKHGLNEAKLNAAIDSVRGGQ